MILNFNHIESSKSDNKKGKSMVCRSCNYKFRFLSSEDKTGWINQNMICPSCGIINCVKPKSERQLSVLQSMFFNDKDNKLVQNQFYNLYKKYSRSLILKYFSNVVNDPDEIEYHSHNSVTKVFFQYLNRPDFKIFSSFGDYVTCKIRESIWHKDEHDTGHHSIHETTEEGKQKFDPEGECSLSFHYQDVMESEDLIKNLYHHLIIDIYSHKEIKFKLLLALNAFLKSGEKGSNKIFATYGIEGKSRFYRILDRFKRKLQDSIQL